MDIEIIKKLIKRYQPGHSGFITRAEKARNYYRNKTDILIAEPKKKEEQEERPLRNADNRIPFNFHGLLVNQKASYMFAAPPLFDLGDKDANKQLTKFLGDKYAKVCKDLCIEASNCTVGWLHLWKDSKSGFKYAVVPAEQIIPIWNKSLEKELEGVLRTYQEIDEDSGDTYIVYEYWNDTECNTYRHRTCDDINLLSSYQMFIADPQTGDATETYRHGMGEIPFFPFFNNNIDTDDLVNIKPLIDSYCKVFSGFVNDLEDIQEVIFVLTNYGGADLGEFLSDLKNYKAIQVESGGSDDKSGVSTLTIELPVEAREKLLTTTRKCIFEQGQGIDPDPQNFGNSSGVALNFLYSLLELKAGLQETEFKLAFGRFIRCVCRLQNINIKEDTIIQTWTRTSVKNDTELADIADKSMGVISRATIVAHHPWVEDSEQEMEAIKEEDSEQEERQQTVTDMLTKNGASGLENEEGEGDDD